MRDIKFRQPTFIQGKFNGFHYWGFIDDVFYGPLTGRHLSASQQFTGLYDINGQTIYEGDIMNDGEINYQVLYLGDRFMLKLTMSNAISSNLFLMNLAKYYEVIGNIYENPELLTIE